MPRTKADKAAVPEDVEGRALSAKGRLDALIARASKGDDSAVPELRRAMDAAGKDLVDLSIGLGAMAELSLVSTFTLENFYVRELLLSETARLRKEVAGPDPTPLVRMLAERLVMCWLQVQLADLRLSCLGSAPLAVGDYHERQRERANRSFLAASRTFATVKKLGTPTMFEDLGKLLDRAKRAQDEVTIDNEVSR